MLPPTLPPNDGGDSSWQREGECRLELSLRRACGRSSDWDYGSWHGTLLGTKRASARLHDTLGRPPLVISAQRQHLGKSCACRNCETAVLSVYCAVQSECWGLRTTCMHQKWLVTLACFRLELGRRHAAFIFPATELGLGPRGRMDVRGFRVASAATQCQPASPPDRLPAIFWTRLRPASAGMCESRSSTPDWLPSLLTFELHRPAPASCGAQTSKD